MSDTPETDKAERMAFSQEYMVPTEFARKLERERDEAMRLLSDLLAIIHRDGGHHTANVGLVKSVEDANKKWAYLINGRDEARHEIEGWKNKFNYAVDMGARAENELAKLKEAAKSVVEIWETPPWKIDATPSKAITKLRDAIGYED